jgi:SAM-dependent methyltransferase
MKTKPGISLAEVKDVYSGPEGQLWELIMGQQIHIGGFKASMDLAGKAEIAKGALGVDLCCCNGAGMRFLVRFLNVGGMTGVDATQKVVEQGERLTREEQLSDRIKFVLADATDTGLPAGEADFVWGEDAWCYVEDKTKLIAEAARLVKSGGTIAFSDWVEGPAGLSDEEADRFLSFMTFPNVQDIAGYRKLLEDNGCEVLIAEDTGRFPRAVELYINMIDFQLAYDALRIIGWDTEMLGAMAGEMQFMHGLADAGKIAQGRFIARKK